jgi:hypothetical protein
MSHSVIVIWLMAYYLDFSNLYHANLAIMCPLKLVGFFLVFCQIALSAGRPRRRRRIRENRVRAKRLSVVVGVVALAETKEFKKWQSCKGKEREREVKETRDRPPRRCLCLFLTIGVSPSVVQTRQILPMSR